MRPRHPARTARGVTAGLSAAAAFGIVAALAAGDPAAPATLDAPDAPASEPETVLEVRVGPAASDTSVAASAQAWLAGDEPVEGTRVVEVDPGEREADTRTAAS